MTNYQEALKELDDLSDNLGLEIDPGIRKIVAALRMHDYNTYGSCEGHMEQWGLPYPWVDINGEGCVDKIKNDLDNFYSIRKKSIATLQAVECPGFADEDNFRLQSPSQIHDGTDVPTIPRNEDILLYLRNEMNVFADYLINKK